MQRFRFLDRERELAYSLASIKRIQERYKDGRQFSIDEIPALVLEGLKREDPNITAEDVAEIIDIETLGELCTAIHKASSLGKPASDERPTQEVSSNGEPSPAITSESLSQSSGN